MYHVDRSISLSTTSLLDSLAIIAKKIIRKRFPVVARKKFAPRVACLRKEYKVMESKSFHPKTKDEKINYYQHPCKNSFCLEMSSKNKKIQLGLHSKSHSFLLHVTFSVSLCHRIHYFKAS